MKSWDPDLSSSKNQERPLMGTWFMPLWMLSVAIGEPENSYLSYLESKQIDNFGSIPSPLICSFFWYILVKMILPSRFQYTPPPCACIPSVDFAIGICWLSTVTLFQCCDVIFSKRALQMSRNRLHSLQYYLCFHPPLTCKKPGRLEHQTLHFIPLQGKSQQVIYKGAEMVKYLQHAVFIWFRNLLHRLSSWTPLDSLYISPCPLQALQQPAQPNPAPFCRRIA